MFGSISIIVFVTMDRYRVRDYFRLRMSWGSSEAILAKAVAMIIDLDHLDDIYHDVYDEGQMSYNQYKLMNRIDEEFRKQHEKWGDKARDIINRYPFTYRYEIDVPFGMVSGISFIHMIILPGIIKI